MKKRSSYTAHAATLALTFLLAWKTLFTHAAIPEHEQPSERPTVVAAALESHWGAVAQQASSPSHPHTPSTQIPHHLEDLRVFRSALPYAVEPVNDGRGSPLQVEVLASGEPWSTGAPRAAHSANRQPPEQLPQSSKKLHVPLQVWRI